MNDFEYILVSTLPCELVEDGNLRGIHRHWPLIQFVELFGEELDRDPGRGRLVTLHGTLEDPCLTTHESRAVAFDTIRAVDHLNIPVLRVKPTWAGLGHSRIIPR